MRVLNILKSEWKSMRRGEKIWHTCCLVFCLIVLCCTLYYREHVMIPELNARALHAMVLDYVTYIQTGVY